MAENGARFYASAAPEWWRYQIVSLGNKRLPPKRLWFYRILVDNGMFKYYKTSREPPDLDKWYTALTRFIHDVERLRKPEEIAVILPDWLNNPSFTLKAAKHHMAREICKDYDCYIVVHSEPTLIQWMNGEWYGGYAKAAQEAIGIPYIIGLAAPLKLNCSRMVNGRRIIRLHCQAAVAEQVCGIARRLGLRCHGLGIALRPQHIKKMIDIGLTSFDSSSWTRPNNSTIARTARWSAKTKTEKELFFKSVLLRLHEIGANLTGLEEVIKCSETT